MPTMPIEERLSALHAHYVWRINAAVAADRMDLVHDLVDEYENEALEAMLEDGAPARMSGVEAGTVSYRDFGPAEILDSGGGTPWRRGADRSDRSRFWFWRR